VTNKEEMTRWQQIQSGLRTFISSGEEWHALCIGISEVACPWPPRHALLSLELEKALAEEHHYYLFGRALGLVAWLGIAWGIKELM